MRADKLDFREIFFKTIPVKNIVEVDKKARERYASLYAKPPSQYTERLSHHEVRRLLLISPITLVRVKSKSEHLRYRVISGLKTWSIVRVRSDFDEVPCLVLPCDYAPLRDRINQTELVTCQALMRSEASNEEWVRAQEWIWGAQWDEDDTGPPKLDKAGIANLLNVTKQTVENMRKRARHAAGEEQV